VTAAAPSNDNSIVASTTGHAGPRRGTTKTACSLLMLSALAIGVAVLTALGIWQLERRVWKLDLIDQVERRIHAVPVAAPGPAAWPAVNAADDAYRRVHATGHFLNGREILVQAVTELGAGFWVVAPFHTNAGFTVLVNRGFVPPERRDPTTRAASRITGEATVTGLMRMTEPNGAFLRANDPATDRWYSRDVAAIAAARELADVAPYFIDADSTPDPDGQLVGGLTVVSFPNNHLVYALTWFALAMMLAGAAVFVARDDWRIRENSPNIGG
jgi:surfeit locus 1 family protein